MPICEILNILTLWTVVTILGFWLITKFKSERTTFVGGGAFLCLGVLVPLLLTAFLNNYLTCSLPTCEVAKIQSQTLIALFGISWASIGANLLASYLSHK